VVVEPLFENAAATFAAVWKPPSDPVPGQVLLEAAEAGPAAPAMAISAVVAVAAARLPVSTRIRRIVLKPMFPSYFPWNSKAKVHREGSH